MARNVHVNLTNEAFDKLGENCLTNLMRIFHKRTDEINVAVRILDDPVEPLGQHRIVNRRHSVTEMYKQRVSYH